MDGIMRRGNMRRHEKGIVAMRVEVEVAAVDDDDDRRLQK